MPTAAAVWVDVLPSMQGFGSALNKQVSSAADGASRNLSKSLNTGADAAGKSAGEAVSGRLGGAFDSVFSRAEKLSATAGNGISRNVGSALTSTLGPLGRFRDGFNSAEAAASAFSGTAGSMGGRARQAVTGVSNAVSSMGENLRTASTQARAVLAPLARMARTAGMAAVAAGVGAIGFAGARTAMQLEQSEAALAGLYGSGEMATDMLARLRGLAGTSPIDYVAFARGAESLAYMGYSGDVAYDVLRQVNTALVAGGKGAAEMDRVNYAMTEMVNTGKVYAEQISQMSQAGLPVWSMLADYMGASIADVREQVQAGAVEIDTVMAAIQAGGGETFAKMEAAAEQSAKTLSSTWSRVRDSVTLAAADMMRPFTGGAASALSGVGDAVVRAFQGVPGVLASVGRFLLPLVDGFRTAGGVIGSVLLPPLQTVGRFLAGTFGGAVRAVTGFLSDHKIVLYAVGGVLGVIAASLAVTQGAMLAYQGVMLGVRVATTAWTVAQWALNAAMLNNPIGYVVLALAGLGAAVVYAWNHFETFRNVVTTAWSAISSAASTAWSVLSPVFSAIGTAAQWLWSTVLQPVFSAIGAGWRVMATGVSTLWKTLLKPVWNAVAAAAQWLWNTVLRTVFTAIQTHWQLMTTAISVAWNGILKPVFTAVATTAQWLWRTVLRPVFSSIGAGWNLLMRGMQTVWNTVLRPVFDLIKTAVHSVGQAFANVVEWVRSTWSQLGEIAKRPVNFVVDVVYNKGIRPVWNGIAGVFGMDELEPAAMLASGGTIPPFMTSGPTLVGEGNPAHPEYVIPTDPKYRSRAAGLWASAAQDLGVPGYASGGILGGAWNAVKGAAGKVASGFSSAFDWVASIAGNIGGGVKKLFSSVFASNDNMPGKGGFVDVLKKIPGKVVDSIIDKVKGWFTSPAGDGGGYGMIPAAAAGAGVQRWAPVVLQALSMLGQPASYLGITLRRMNQESGGNPNIGNFWDSNAVKGTPSMGLMQVIGPTFSAYRDPRAPNNLLDPLANILASMRYAIARYGSLPAAYNKPGGYRNGGWLMPGQLAFNETKRPEPILSAEQWDDVQRLSRDRDGRNQITVNARTEASPAHIAAAIDRRIALRART